MSRQNSRDHTPCHSARSEESSLSRNSIALPRETAGITHRVILSEAKNLSSAATLLLYLGKTAGITHRVILHEAKNLSSSANKTDPSSLCSKILRRFTPQDDILLLYLGKTAGITLRVILSEAKNLPPAANKKDPSSLRSKILRRFTPRSFVAALQDPSSLRSKILRRCAPQDDTRLLYLGKTAGITLYVILSEAKNLPSAANKKDPSSLCSKILRRCAPQDDIFTEHAAFRDALTVGTGIARP